MINKGKIAIIFIFITILVLLIFLENKNTTYALGETLSSVIINQSKGTTWSSGALGVYNTTYIKEDGTTMGNDYRYIGGDVNNYVSFNDDMYQIIGVFDENTHGKTGKQLVKLIRARTLGDYSLGVYNKDQKNGAYLKSMNAWADELFEKSSNVNVLLNQFFLYRTNMSDDYGNCTNWTYFQNGDLYKKENCKTFVGYGIKEKFRDYIETVTWHLNGSETSEMVSNDWYLCERGIYSNCNSGVYGTTNKTSESKIGIMYLSDYMYASGYKESGSIISSEAKENGSQNWLFKGLEWTLTTRTDSDLVSHYIYWDSSIKTAAVYYPLGIRPTFYLKSDVYITGGNGTFKTPYTISCDTCSIS